MIDLCFFFPDVSIIIVGRIKNFMKQLSIRIRALIFSMLTFVILGALLLWVVLLLSAQVRDQRTLDSYYRYLNFNNNLENFIISHSNILYGFSAYINTFDNLDDNEIYDYLENLLENNSEYIRNVGILKDTTIVWNYPRENNSAAIGVDLALVESQAPQILLVKEQNRKVFQGPVNLVQGGIGYIIRIPIRKNGLYWGQASIVIDGDQFIRFMDEISRQANIQVLVQDNGQNQAVMYGDTAILEKKTATISMSNDFGIWEISYIPIDPNPRNLYSSIILVILMGSSIIVLITLVLYRYILKNLHLANQNISLSQTATTDRLTGIFNRSMLESYILSELERSDKLGYDISLILFDLDHFKNVNDTYGHDAGDRVLINTVSRAKEIIRKSDFFVRWGGEEFLVILPGINLNDATRLAEKLRIAIAGIDHTDVGTVTMSAGIAQRLEFEFWTSWFKRADKALYKAKESGRNRLSISMDMEPIKKESANLQWKNEWFSGNTKIDSQHKTLMEDANNMIEVFKVDPEKFSVLYDKFIQSLEVHFRYEEGILNRVGYPFLEEHQKIHSHIISSIKRTEENMEYYISSPEVLFDYILEEILIGHFLQEDFKFFNYL